MIINLIYGGRSVEHDWSVAMYNHVADVINGAPSAKISVSSIYYIDHSGILHRHKTKGFGVPQHEAFLRIADQQDLGMLAPILRSDPHFVFSLLQGQDGEDGQIQALAQFHDIPGSFGDKTAAVVAADKHIQCLIATQVCPELTPINAVQIVNGRIAEGATQVRQRLIGPCVYKPNTLGGSFLTECVNMPSEDSILAYAERISSYDASFLVQQRIFGTEYTCGIIVEGHEVRALPVARIDNPSGFLGYDQKTQKGSYSVEFEGINSDLARRIASISVRLAQEFRLHTFARLDYIVDDANRVYFFEVNLVPGLTAGSIFPKMLKRAGFDLVDLILLAASNEVRLHQWEAHRKAETSRIRYGCISAAVA